MTKPSLVESIVEQLIERYGILTLLSTLALQTDREIWAEAVTRISGTRRVLDHWNKTMEERNENGEKDGAGNGL